MSYVDLHLHLLPGVDDGAADVDEALVYARRMAAEGVTEATVTPHIARHVPLDVCSIAGRVAALQKEIDAHGIELTLHPGGEIHPNRAASLRPHELEAIAQGPADARWLLFEVPFAGVDAAYVRQCERFLGLGYGVLVAHPERAEGLMDGGLDLLDGLLGDRVRLQVNVCSLLGHHGAPVRRAAVELVRSGACHVIASDGHPGTREQTLRLGFDLAIRAGTSSLVAWRLTQDHPRALLERGLRPAVLAGAWAPAVRALAA